MGKLSFLVGIGVGYVLGTKAGERRYEQIKLQASKAWEHPAVQEKVAKAGEQIRERGPEVAAAAGQAAARGAGQAVKNAATAGFHAATGKKEGPVVQGTIAEGAPADAAGVTVVAADDVDPSSIHDVDPTVGHLSVDPADAVPVNADTDSGETKLS